METTITQIKVTEVTASKYPRKYEYKQQASDSPYAPSRVFVDFGEDVWTHLANRRSRDYNTLRPLIAAKLIEQGIKFEKLSWNRYAGCSMCPCSGGFVLTNGEVGVDYWAKIETVNLEAELVAFA
jgi:hypothetical protein